MYGIKNSNGETIRGMWTSVSAAGLRACEHSKTDEYIWKVIQGDKVFAEFQHGKLILNEVNPTQEHELATAIHGKLCYQNHTDGCDWFYGDRWDQEFTAKHEYLKKARAMLDNGIEFDQAMKVITNL